MRAHGQAPALQDAPACPGLTAPTTGTVGRLIRSPPPPRMRRRRGAPRPRHPALTQDAVQAQLLVALAAVGHVPGHGDVHRQVPGAVHGLGAPPPGDPRAAGGVGGSGQLDGLHLLDALGHAVVAQVVAQQGQAFLCEGGIGDREVRTAPTRGSPRVPSPAGAGGDPPSSAGPRRGPRPAEKSARQQTLRRPRVDGDPPAGKRRPEPGCGAQGAAGGRGGSDVGARPPCPAPRPASAAGEPHACGAAVCDR